MPKPLVQAFAWPEVRTRVTVDGVVAVVDAEAAAEGRFAPDPAAVQAQRAADPSLDHDSPLAELFEEQVLCADLIVLNKLDRVDERGRADAEAEVARHLRPAARTVGARFGEVDPRVLLGLGAAAEDDLASRPSPHADTGEHEHDDFDSFVLRLPDPASPEQLLARVRGAAEAHGILRAKGFAAVARPAAALRPPGGGAAGAGLLRPAVAGRRDARDAAGGDRRARAGPGRDRPGARGGGGLLVSQGTAHPVSACPAEGPRRLAARPPAGAGGRVHAARGGRLPYPARHPRLLPPACRRRAQHRRAHPLRLQRVREVRPHPLPRSRPARKSAAAWTKLCS